MNPSALLGRLGVVFALLFSIAALIIAWPAAPPNLGSEDLPGLASAYLKVVADQNGLKLEGVKVLAYRVEGDTAVVRAVVRFQQVIFGVVVGPVTTSTIVVHLNRSLWHVAYAKVAG